MICELRIGLQFAHQCRLKMQQVGPIKAKIAATTVGIV